MAIYINNRGMIAVGIETTRGNAAALTKDAHALLCANFVEPKLTHNPHARSGRQKGTPGSLPPFVGKRAHAVSIQVEDRMTTVAVDASTGDAQWDNRGWDALARACGFAAPACAAGTRTYTPATLPGETCTIEVNQPPKWTQIPGASGTWSFESTAGGPALWTFDMMGAYHPPEEDGILGTTWTDDVPMSRNAADAIIKIGSFTTPFVTAFKVAANCKVQPREVRNDLERAVYYAAACTDGSSTFVNETTDINETTANDVSPFPSAATGDYFALCCRHRPRGYAFNIGTAGVGTYTIAFKYYNGSSFTTFTPTFDNSLVLKTTGKVYVILPALTDWARTTVNSVEGYWIELVVTMGTMTTVPLITQAWTLYDPNETHSAEIVDFDYTCNMTVEMEAAATFSPLVAMEDMTTFTLDYIGATSRIYLPSASLNKFAEIKANNGKTYYDLEFLADHSVGATPITIYKYSP